MGCVALCRKCYSFTDSKTLSFANTHSLCSWETLITHLHIPPCSGRSKKQSYCCAKLITDLEKYIVHSSDSDHFCRLWIAKRISAPCSNYKAACRVIQECLGCVEMHSECLDPGPLKKIRKSVERGTGQYCFSPWKGGVQLLGATMEDHMPSRQKRASMV